MVSENWKILAIVTGISLLIGIWASVVSAEHRYAWYRYCACTWKILLLAVLTLAGVMFLESTQQVDGSTALLMYGLITMFGAAFGQLGMTSLRHTPIPDHDYIKT